ncbi:MAG: 5-formyltetrahydrofolate cyclo-ligase [bacterium]|nr:5-formyltetrahydrofolate cyclo-ligase [bacterium]
MKDASRADPGEEKEAWRRRMRELRESLSPERHEILSQCLCRRLDVLLASLNVRRVGVYWAVRGEADLSSLWKGVSSAGRVYFFPRVSGDSLTFHRVRDPRQELRPDAFGIPAPPDDAPPSDPSALDAVVAPGLAFDLFGGRLGQGAGFYDRFLGGLNAPPAMIGVGFGFQLTWGERLPLHAGDVLMNWVLTDREAVRCLPFTYSRSEK